MDDYTLEIGCFYCYDNKRKKEKEPLYFFDAANNLRECDFCPKCGRRYGEVKVNEQLEPESEQFGSRIGTI